MTTPVDESLPRLPHISVVSTMYRSRAFLEEFLGGCLRALEEMACEDFEIILVNDGSPDDSLVYVRDRKRDIPQLVLVDLSRNFGHHNAMQAGLQVARGDLVFLIDCDLEVAPAVLGDLYRKQQATGADLVFGYQEARKGGWVERISGGWFWTGFNLLSDVKVPENMVTERVMTRRFVNALLSMGDRNLFLGGMMSWTGFDQIGLSIAKGQRQGASTYTLARRGRLLVNAVTSFSAQPLMWLFYAGLTITIASFTYGAHLVIRRFLFGDVLVGFTSVMALLALSLGVVTTAIGLLGIYLGKIFIQVQNRPNYLIKDIWR